MRNIIALCALLIGIVIPFGVLAMDEMKNGSKEYINPSSVFFLNKSEIKKLEIQSKDGDIDASIKLSNFFCFIKNDKKEQVKFLRRAAQNGHVVSQYNLWVILNSNKDNKSKKEAMYWLEKAGGSGDKEAQIELERLGRRSKSR